MDHVGLHVVHNMGPESINKISHNYQLAYLQGF